ncbi:MAG: plasmid stabilization protein [Gammaproteobacteria bacterium]|nr:MAG: plasmid stabilization protein [Gammaproteobacteria bacterium]
MANYLVQKAASFRLDEIYQYSLNQWGEKKAKVYISELFDTFSTIEKNKLLSRSIPSEFSVRGYYYQHKKHFVYWKYLKSGEIGIVTILHQRMHQLKHFKNLPVV